MDGEIRKKFSVSSREPIHPAKCNNPEPMMAVADIQSNQNGNITRAPRKNGTPVIRARADASTPACQT